MSNVRIGIVCEGPTDAVVIKAASERFLAEHGWQATVFSIQPTRDKTLGEQGGWTMVRDWLLANDHDLRCRRYFGLGLFANDLDALRCDIMFIHLDSDIINDPAFNENLPPEVRTPESDRDYVANKLAIWLDRASFGEADQHRYVSGVAVQSTETWCLALFGGQLANIEALEGDLLGVAFNTALLASESNPDAQVAGVPKKNRNRRERYVEKQATSAGLQRAMSNSPSFQRAFSTLKRSAEQIVPRE